MVALNSCDTESTAVYLPEAHTLIGSKIGDPVIENVEQLNAGRCADAHGAGEGVVRAVVSKGDDCGESAAAVTAGSRVVVTVIAVLDVYTAVAGADDAADVLIAGDGSEVYAV